MPVAVQQDVFRLNVAVAAVKLAVLVVDLGARFSGLVVVDLHEAAGYAAALQQNPQEILLVEGCAWAFNWRVVVTPWHALVFPHFRVTPHVFEVAVGPRKDESALGAPLVGGEQGDEVFVGAAAKSVENFDLFHEFLLHGLDVALGTGHYQGPVRGWSGVWTVSDPEVGIRKCWILGLDVVAVSPENLDGECAVLGLDGLSLIECPPCTR